ncbi:MBL fold metallo-hydrolase [Litorivicinus sp.]|nr:MBL fold metallo-hydrolase [Litorivicinus sp.]MDB9862422.1 MBL fold metallo-hydrolase [Litorivicinus sp.]MDC1208627.1 MBL fold metallo-hydrolase [Litorivicinus sp.]
MRFCSLGSGSRGNGTVVNHGHTNILVDCGFGYRDALKRMKRIGLSPENLTAVIVTHEHGDHWGGVNSLASKHRLPVFASRGTWIEVSGHGIEDCHEIHDAFQIGSIRILPVRVPHDSRESIQCVFEAGEQRLGVLSDLGSVSGRVIEMFSGLDALSIEFNHDWQMLQAGPYPSFLKKRVGGDFGHLNNEQACSLLKSIACERLKKVVACHISETNNDVGLVESALEAALKETVVERWVASQGEGTDWIEVGGL